jgi:DNA polymerase-2
MHQRVIDGWLFDVYPTDDGLAVWLIDAEHHRHRLTYNYRPSFFLRLTEQEMKRVPVLAAQCPVPVTLTHTERIEIYSGEPVPVVQVHVHAPNKFRNAVWFFEKFFPHFAFYDSDISVAQLFLYEHDLFPLMRGEFIANERNELIAWHSSDTREALEYALPPLSVLWLNDGASFLPPKYRTQLQLEISYDGKTYGLEQHEPRAVLEAFNWHLHRCNPDILMTEYGDAVLLPKLTALARQLRVPLLLNRDVHAEYVTSKGSSYFQYGKIVHKDGAFELAGRWHIDAENSFTVGEADLDGAFEMARLTQLCGQRQARASIGTSMSSMQLSWARRHNILVPAKKREPEDFKSAATLLLADRGGLIFNPSIGYHEEVAELDFVSMYPSIMVNHNVSPETVNCRCCKNNAVPELRYSICERREGIVPATLRIAVAKRSYYKKQKLLWKKKNEAKFKMYDNRQNALKWMLVSCFGYLGYKNARFGRIEAHESVNAFSRDIILTAKEISEANGYQLLHAIIDCVWLKKTGATEEDYRALAKTIAERAGVDLSLEGIYNWILFPSSRTDPEIATANHYVGWYRHGDMKVRGLETRRHDAPKFVQNLQLEMLTHLSRARNVAEVEQEIPTLLEIARTHLAILRSGKANPMELVMKKHISKEPDEYTNNSVNAVVAKMIQAMGMPLAPGESIEFIIVDQSGKKKPEKAKPLALYAFEDGYDIEQYTEFALRAVEVLLLPFGYDVEKLREVLGFLPEKKSPARTKRKRAGTIWLFDEMPV